MLAGFRRRGPDIRYATTYRPSSVPSEAPGAGPRRPPWACKRPGRLRAGAVSPPDRPARIRPLVRLCVLSFDRFYRYFISKPGVSIFFIDKKNAHEGSGKPWRVSGSVGRGPSPNPRRGSRKSRPRPRGWPSSGPDRRGTRVDALTGHAMPKPHAERACVQQWRCDMVGHPQKKSGRSRTRVAAATSCADQLTGTRSNPPRRPGLTRDPSRLPESFQSV